MEQNIYYSFKQNTLIIYKEGVLTRVSRRDLIYMSQACKPTAIQVWVDDSFENKDEEFASDYIKDFARLITPKKIVNSWLINQNPDFLLLPVEDKEEIRNKFANKYGISVFNSSIEPVNPNIAREFSDTVLYHKDKMAFEPFEVA